MELLSARELRIGNLFIEENSNEIIEVIGLEKNRILFSGMFLNEWQSKPIPLTEEWLLKFGFEKIIDNEFTLRYDLKKDSRFDYFFPKHNLKTFGLRFQGSTFFDVVKYVHQLQNIYFCLCGKELIINN